MKMMNHIRQLLVQTIGLFLRRQRHLILLHHHRRFLHDDNADYDTPRSGSQGAIQYHDPEDEAEEPVLNEEEIERLQSEDSESTRQYESEFVQFDGDYFVLPGHNRQRPIFNPMMSKVSRSLASTSFCLTGHLCSYNLVIFKLS